MLLSKMMTVVKRKGTFPVVGNVLCDGKSIFKKQARQFVQEEAR